MKMNFSIPFTYYYLLISILIFAGCRNREDSTKLQGEKILIWNYPVERTHAGALMANGTQGLMIWGNKQLNITIGRAGFWDHRGGNDFMTKVDYPQVKRLLQSKDEAGLKKAFGKDSKDQHLRPHQIGGGILQLNFPDSWKPYKGELYLSKGEYWVYLRNDAGEEALIKIYQAAFEELAWIQLPQALNGKVKTELVPSWEFVHQTLAAKGVAPPERWTSTQSGATSGFVQSLPEDDPLAIGILKRDENILLATHVGPEAKDKVDQLLTNSDLKAQRSRTQRWWAEYWKSVPVIQLPDPQLQELLDYGLYKQASATPPHGIAATLQGPFLESYQLPPWSADYHFNINIQMIYWPTLATNRLAHMEPLWKMVLEWLPDMQANGEFFFKQPGAIMMPHAVDDRGKVVGTFWTGSIDHACAAWIAQMAWLHYRYSMDEQVLQNVAWPLLQGTFEGYWGMLEEKVDKRTGKTRFTLPVTVSPEFKGDQMDAWGPDASFQLAALHLVAETLQKAANLLQKPQDPRWQEVIDKLPPYTTMELYHSPEYPISKKPRIVLWDGMDLIQSHRHHSHLAGIYPFVTIDPADTIHKDIVASSIQHWVLMGSGAWSGWCVPWAASLQARLGNAQAAVGWLHHFKNYYTNEGRGTLHDAAYPGMSVIANKWTQLPEGKANREIMQLDGGFGAITAITELLVQQRRDGLYILPSLPPSWSQLHFDGILTEGAFLVGATVKNHRVEQIRITSQADTPLKIWHGLGDKWLVNGLEQKGDFFETDARSGEIFVLERIM